MLCIWRISAFIGFYIVFAEVSTPRRYVLHLTPSTWSQGETTCRESGARLATIYDYSTVPDIFLGAEYLLSHKHVFWIGLHRKFANQSYVWENGDSITWFNWKPGMTDNGSTLCVGASSSKPYSWVTMDCGSRLPFLCQHEEGECRFVEFVDMSIASHNYMYLYQKNENHCKDVCVTELGTRCRSFDYYPVSGQCEFNSGDRWTLDKYYGYKQGWVYFHRTCNSGEVVNASISPSQTIGCVETSKVYVTHDIYSSHFVTITQEVSTARDIPVTRDIQITRDVQISRDIPVTRDVIVTSTHRTTVTLTETSTHVIVASPAFVFLSASASEDPIEELKEIGEVAVERKKTLKKISVDDHRPSAKYVGYVAIIFMSCVFGSIVLFDLLTLFRYQKMCCNASKNDSQQDEDSRNLKKAFDWTKIRAKRKEFDVEKEELKNKMRQRNVSHLNEETYTPSIEDGPTTSYKSDLEMTTGQRSKMIWRPFIFHTGDSGIEGSDMSSSPSQSDRYSDIFHFQYLPNDLDNDSTEIDTQNNIQNEESDLQYEITEF